GGGLRAGRCCCGRMKRGNQRRNLRRGRFGALRPCGRGRGRRCNRSWRRSRGLLRTYGMPRLCRGSLCRTRAQLLAGRLTRPRTGIDVAHHTQPLLGFGLAGEESHMETKALASLFETATDEKGEASAFV